jgi:selenocysteine-specific elongation factor
MTEAGAADPAARPPRDRAALIVGTAGHIDHGKTSLIRALTGLDLDRLPEEKARGITIDLGFAPLDLPGGERVGIVDVPGHEGLVRTMVAGATGIDVVLLVVAADEGVMPQTREHVAICDLLDVRSGVVAITRSDLVDAETCELAEAEISDLLTHTSLAGAPVVAVSSHTGDGVDVLRDTLARVCAETTPRTPRHGPPRLHVDRVFTLRGFGSVVTGTLVGGALESGDAIALLPGAHTARIRGLQQHGEPADRVMPGARCAVNLQGIDHEALGRGQVLTHPGRLAETDVLDVRIHWLDTSPEAREVVAVELLCGTCERRARLAPIGPGARLVPGASGFARLHIDGPPIAALPGDRFVVRGFTRHDRLGHTLGGGRFVDIAPPRRRRSDPALLAELETLSGSGASPGDAVAVRVARAGLAGIAETDVALQAGLDPAHLDAEARSLVEAGSIHRTPAGRLIDTEVLARLAESLIEALAGYHRSEPLRPGMSGAALRATLPENVARDTAEAALWLLEGAGRIVVSGELVRLPEHEPTLDERTQALVEHIARDAREAGLEPLSPRDHGIALGIEPVEYRDLVAHLERGGVLVRAPGDLWFDRAVVDELRKRLVSHLEAHGEIDTQTYKTLIGTTRRTAMPLMELFDELQVTRRRGDVRVLRGGGDRG